MAGEPCFSLSLNQRNIWNLEQTYPGTSMNHISTTIHINGRIDLNLLEKSIHMVLKSDASLRTRLCMKEGEPFQYQVDYDEEPFLIYDFSHTNEEGIRNWQEAVAREAMPLFDRPLYRFFIFKTGDSSGGVMMKLHHLISDGWTQVLVSNRIAENYMSFLRGEEPPLTEAPNYRLHVEEEQAYLASPAFERDKKYWKERFEKGGVPAVLSASGGAVISPVGRRVGFRFPETLNHAVYQFCTERRAAPFAVFYMALAIYFRRMGQEGSLVIGVPVINRTNYRFKQSTGMFVSTLPFFCEIDEAWCLDEFYEHMQENWYDLLRHQRFPLSRMEELRGVEQKNTPLFEIAFSYEDSRIMENRDTSITFSGGWHYSGYQSEQLCIHLNNLESERRYAVNYDYLTQLFSEDDITKFHRTLECIMMQMLQNPKQPICRLQILRAEDMERVLYTYNQTGKYVPGKNLKEVFKKVCREYPERAAVIYQGRRLNYRELGERAGNISRKLTGSGAKPGEVVAILMPKCFELYELMAAIMLSGCGWLLIPTDLPEKRIQKILEKSGALLLVTDRSYLTENLQRMGDMGAIKIIEKEELDQEYVSEQAEQEQAGKDDLAYVVYTSGSTGEPKGVAISQGNLLNLAAAMKEIYGRSGVLSVSKIGFDVFILESGAALLCGRTIILATDADCESPRRVAGLIKNFGAGFISLTPSRLSAFLRDKAFEQAMRQMECIICGGEAFPPVLLNQLKGCTQARIYNQYGPSETTVAVSMKQLNDTDRITAGKPMDNCRLYVLDAWKNPLLPGISGELYVGGKCVGLGYWKDEALTREAFTKSPFEEGERIYRTGDIACWTEDGEIILSGRADSQVKLRGLRIELSEIGAVLSSHPSVKESTACVRNFRGRDLIIAYYTEKEEEKADELELRTYLASLLPEYMLPDIFMCLDRIPLTANGKVDERHLPLPTEAEAAGTAAGRKAKGPLAEALTALFAKTLQRDDLSEESDYFLCGGNSLNAMELLGDIEETLGRRLRVSDLYACRTPGRLAVFMGEKADTDEGFQRMRRPYEKAPLDRPYSLSSVQQGMYIQSIMAPQNLAYHMPGAFRLEQTPDTDRMEEAFQQVVDTEPMLRTGFEMKDGQVCAVIHEHAAFHMETVEGQNFEAACKAFLRPFVMDTPPLMRAALWTMPEGGTMLLMDCHHIIGDGTSTPLLLERVESWLAHGKSAASEWNYYDHLANKPESRPETVAYWKDHLAGLPEPAFIPKDVKCSTGFSWEGQTTGIQLGIEQSRRLEAFCEQKGITPFVLFAGAWGILHARVSGKSRLVVGTPVSLRRRPETQKICGPMIDTLPLCLDPLPEKSTSQYLDEIRTEVEHLLEYDDISLEKILTELNLPRKVGENALYQVMIAMTPFDISDLKLFGKPVDYVPVPTGTAKMDWAMEFGKTGESYQLRFEYTTEHENETAAFYARTMEMLLDALCGADENMLIGQLPLMGAQDQYRFMDIPNAMSTPFLNLPAHRQIENTIRQYPGKTAVIWHGQKTTYAGLGEMADRYAAQFYEAGIRKGSVAGIMCRRTPELYGAILAVLKCGAAYVPLLNTFPEKRIEYMLKTAGADKILCDQATWQDMPQSLRERAVVWTNEGNGRKIMEPPVSGEDMLHILFTSGSTGHPKGVMIRQHSMSNLIQISREWYQDIDGGMIAATTPTFDIFASEGLIPLALGKTIVLADEEEMLLPWKLAELIDKYDGQFIQFTASRLQMCMNNDAFCQAAKNLKFTIVGGEAVPEDLVRRFCQFGSGRLVNLYGPTEATVYTTMTDLKEGETVTIGKPLPNYRVYILDEEAKPVMPTAAGEIYIAGQGVAAGYVGREDLTEKTFVPDIFYPGEKMYKSGDLGRLRADGTIDYLGRIDGQIKVNGQRVETGEIEAIMRKTGLTKEALVLPVKNPDGSAYLCGFYTAKTECSEKMRLWLKKELPEYMIPGRLIRLTQFPYTEGGKMDRQKLIRLAKGPEDVKTEPVRKEPSQKMRMAEIWKTVLGKTDVQDQVSFFEQGGTSLSALNVLSRYFNEGIEMTMAQFYAAPTLAEQAAFLGEEEQETAGEMGEPAGEKEMWPRHVPEGGMVKDKVENFVFLTGATGFFGAHLVKELLDEGVGKICCLCRGGSERLKETLAWYFGAGWLAAHEMRLETVTGCLEDAYFGLDREKYLELAKKTDGVYHCAADVRHYVSDEAQMEAVNVAGTEHVIRFALDGNCPLHHMSTASVAGDHLVGTVSDEMVEYTEQDFYVGQNWEDNKYVRSKFLAEAAVYRNMRENGLKAHVYRLGMITERMSDGVFQKNADTNAAWMLVKGARELGALPKTISQDMGDRMPVDICAKMVGLLSWSPMTTFHVVNPDPARLIDMIRKFAPEVREVSDEEFESILHREWAHRDIQTLAPLIDRWNQQKKDRSTIRVACAKTQEELKRLGFNMEVWRKRP